MSVCSSARPWATTSGPSAASAPRRCRGDWSGTPWGLTAGYDRQRGNLVFGGALDLTGGTIEATSTTNPGPPAYICGPGCVTEVSRSAALRGRVGWAQDRTLVYATAGLAVGEATATTNAIELGNDNLSGWVAGFGLEHAVTDRFSLFAEYLFTDLGRLEIPTLCNTNCFTDVTYGTLRIGANLRW